MHDLRRMRLLAVPAAMAMAMCAVAGLLLVVLVLAFVLAPVQVPAVGQHPHGGGSMVPGLQHWPKTGPQ